MHSEVTSGRGVRVERRTVCTTGQESFVPIRSRPTVAREPLPEVYGAVREASQTLIAFNAISTEEICRIQAGIRF